MKNVFYFIVICVPLTGMAQTYNFSFDMNNESWTGFFSEYRAGEEAFYELEFSHINLPLPLDTTKKALKISGNNHSDDLLMCIYRKFDGLVPDKSYEVSFNIDLASNAEKGGFGIGGSPDLMLGAGGIDFLPQNSIDYLSHYRPNFPSLIQAELPNEILDTLGRIGVPGPLPIDYTLINRNNLANPILLKTNANGALWILILIDSSFEGITTLYYNRIEIIFRITNGMTKYISDESVLIFPNPAINYINLSNLDYLDIKKVSLANIVGQVIIEQRVESNHLNIGISDFPRGIYIINMEDVQGNRVSEKIIIH